MSVDAPLANSLRRHKSNCRARCGRNARSVWKVSLPAPLWQPERMSVSREEGVKFLYHAPSLRGLLDAVCSTAFEEPACEDFHDPITVAPDIANRHAGLLLDGGLDLRDFLRRER